MNKVIVVILVSLLFGCGNDANSSGEDGDTDKASKNRQYACAELGVTPESDNSRRIEILKSHGFSATQASEFEQLMALYSSVSKNIDVQNQRKNMFAKQTAVKNQACLDQHSLDCNQILTQLEKGASGQNLTELSSQPLLECIGQ